MKTILEYLVDKNTSGVPKKYKTYDKVFKLLDDGSLEGDDLNTFKEDISKLCSDLKLPETCNSVKIYGTKDIDSDNPWHRAKRPSSEMEGLKYDNSDIHPKSLVYYIDNIYKPVQYNESVILKLDLYSGGSIYLEIQ